MKRNKQILTWTPPVILRASIVAGISCFIMIFLQLIVANHDASQRYERSRYMEELQEIVSEHQKLNLRVIDLQSMDRIVRESARLNLVKADRVQYIESTGSFALREE